jgi:glycosyltransferase involved in cell wall biosynthesis
LLIGVVLANTTAGRLSGWHHRWFEPREIAERLRIALALWMLGARPTSFSGLEPAWTGWYARAICREQRLRSGVLDEQGLSAARAALIALLDDQCDYHRSAAMVAAKLEHRLERFGLILFGATMLTAALFLCLRPLIALTDTEAVSVTVLSAGLPALATATYGIRVIGDFEGIARRSERTHQDLKNLIEAVKQDPLILDRLRMRARRAAEAMLGDVASWRMAAESRRLNIPG